MKRLINLLLALVLVLAMSPCAWADAIYIPTDEFYEDHAVYCTKLERGFHTLCEVKLYENPASSTIKATMSEGAYVAVMYTWTDGLGRKWGYTEYNDADTCGWLPMAYLGDADATGQNLPRYEIRPGFTPTRVMTGIGVVLCVLFTVAVLREKKKEAEKK